MTHLANQSRFLTDCDEIVNCLKMIQHRGCQLSATLKPGNTAFSTVITDMQQQHITFRLPKSKSVSNLLKNSQHITFESHMHDIKVAFLGQELVATTNALQISLPTDILWIQRRIATRVKTPPTHSNHCKLFFGDGREDGTSSWPTSTFKIDDFSASGFSFISSKQEHDDWLIRDDKPIPCLLNLHNGESYILNIFIKYASKLSPSSTLKKIGCAFETLPLTFNQTLHNYLYELGIQAESLPAFST